MIDRFRLNSDKRQKALLLGFALAIVFSQFWVAGQLTLQNASGLLPWIWLSVLGTCIFLGIVSRNCSRYQRLTELHRADSVAKAELLVQLEWQRDQLAEEIANRAARDSRLRLLESAVVHARDAVVILEGEPSGERGRSVIYANEAFTRITGYSSEEVIGRSLHFLRGPRSSELTLDQLRQALDTNSTLQTELLNYRKDGSEVWVELNLVPVFEASSANVAHWVMIQRDATDRKQAEETLRNNEERLRAIYDNTNAAVVVARPDGQLVEVNSAFCRMLGYEEEELLNLTIMDLTHPEDKSAQADRLARVGSGELHHYNFQKRYVHKNGQTVWADLYSHVMHDLAGEPVSLIGVLLDITVTKMAQEALRQSEERYRLLFDYSPQPMWVFDSLSWKFVAVNESALQKYGYSREEFLELSLSDLMDICPEECLTDQLQLAVTLDKDHKTWQHQTKSGELLHVEISANQLPTAIGASNNTLMLITDVTQKQRLEEQLRQSQKMEGIGQLAGGIAHDFNNLLTGIIGNLALIDLPHQDANLQLVRTAERAAQRAAELTRKLLGFARRNQLLLAPLQVQDLISEVIGLLQRTFDPRIELVARTEIQEPIMADATLLNQALLNLCINSRDAMPGGGRLTIGVEIVEVGAEQLKNQSEAREGSHIRITVEDTGNGMPLEVQRRMFEPFFTTKPVGQGTGLGLPMVHGILKQHHGWVNCESIPGQGTRFELYLPRLTSPSEGSTIIRRTMTQRELPLGPPTPRPIRRTRRESGLPPKDQAMILLVDDEEMIREIARYTLETAGYKVVQASDGLEAVEQFRKYHLQLSLVLLDLTMPRLSGRDAFTQMMEINPKVPVMFASGYSTDDLSDVAGAIGLLPKPYRPQDLLQVVKSIVRPVTEPASAATP